MALMSLPRGDPLVENMWCVVKLTKICKSGTSRQKTVVILLN